MGWGYVRRGVCMRFFSVCACECVSVCVGRRSAFGACVCAYVPRVFPRPLCGLCDNAFRRWRNDDLASGFFLRFGIKTSAIALVFAIQFVHMYHFTHH